MNRLLFVLTLLCSGSGFAQMGFVVTISGDTLRGNLILESNEKIDRVRIKNDKSIFLSALQVKSLQIENQTYKPVTYDAKLRFMRVMQDGYLSVLAFQSSHNSFNYDGVLLLKADGPLMELPRLNFKKAMPEFIDDKPLADSIAAGFLGRAELNLIVARYNKKIEIRTAEIMKFNKAVEAGIPAVEIVQRLRNAVVERTFEGKTDALEILQDVESKLTKGETIPSYTLKALQSVLKDQSTTKDLLSDLQTALKN